MPHSTQNHLRDSTSTFDLDELMTTPSTFQKASTPPSKRTSGSFGVALTSTPSHDERSKLPSQQQREKSSPWKRASSPVVPDAYADLIARGGNIDELLGQRKAGDRSSMQSAKNGYDNASKRRSQYYEEQFQYKDNAMSGSREKVHKQSPVIAEMKTNVIIKDEFTLVTDLSHHLAQRYTRPDSSIMIKVDHSACLALGGTFEPCYMLTIHTVPQQIAPSVNKRNAALIQSFMADILSVSADRGIVTFVPIPEDCLATNGNTILGEIERLEKQQQGNESTVKRAIADTARKSMPSFNRKSMSRMNSSDDAIKSNGFLNPNGVPDREPSVTPPTPPGTAPPLFREPSTLNTKDERPSTAHGADYAAQNPLRMNGISTEQLVGQNARTPNGRPKTFGGESAPSIQEQIRKEPLPQHVARQATNKSSVSARDAQRASKVKSANAALAPRPVQQQPVPSTASVSRFSTQKPSGEAGKEGRTRNTYLDGVSSLTRKSEKAAQEDEKRDTAANTAKRRSTITATPKMPTSAPPPIPDDSKSTNSRVSKRKSFLRAIRRSIPT